MSSAATCAQVIAAVAEVGDAAPDRTVFVGIDGFGAAGKSTLAAAVASVIARAVVLHVDDFARPTVSEWEWNRFREQVTLPLLGGTPAHYLVWDWSHDAPGDWLTIEPGRIVIVEGVSSTRSEAGVEWDLTVWVEAPQQTRLDRARERDGAAMMPRWLEDWMPLEQAYARREDPRGRSDLIVDGTA